jgi:urea-proton symporter
MLISTHTTVLFAIILTFVSNSRSQNITNNADNIHQVFTVYATSDKIGSPRRMHDLLAAAAAANPVPGNAHGSYMTMRSKNGLIFGVINVIGNFATVFQDQGESLELISR